MVMKFLDEVKQYFKQTTQKVVVNGIPYTESFGVHYTIEEFSDIQQLGIEKYKPNSQEDELERTEILSYFANSIKTFKEDINTRQVCIQPKYNGMNDLAACLSCIQVVIRQGKLYMFVMCRSQNWKNFLYDNQTYAYITEMLMTILFVDFGGIVVNVTSLHLQTQEQ